jgi:hypothetical protein
VFKFKVANFNVESVVSLHINIKKKERNVYENILCINLRASIYYDHISQQNCAHIIQVNLFSYFLCHVLKIFYQTPQKSSQIFIISNTGSWSSKY